MRTLKRCLAFGLVLAVLGTAHAEEPDDSRIINHIFQTRDEILQRIGPTGSLPPPVFLAFWDFDGTILKGDSSEGLNADGNLIYPGLVQCAIERGLSSLYPPDGGFGKFWTDYTNMEARIGPWLAYPFIPQVLRGAKADDVLQLSRRHFAGTLSNYLMASSLKIIHALDQGGVEPHIISAGADLFVKGAAESLGIPAHRIHGVELRARDGRLTEEIVYPVTWNIGKLEKLQAILAQMERESPGRRVFVLAGFGDSYPTDGPFLKFIATQSLPAGKPIAVFYDSKKEPDEYHCLFYQARHSRTISDPVSP
ncbi:MAG: HAD family hydrolase [Verrucomicrobia bacterium]|nr:HAD family hydrolase [Verrucomicrobiota bacterium]